LPNLFLILSCQHYQCIVQNSASKTFLLLRIPTRFVKFYRPQANRILLEIMEKRGYFDLTQKEILIEDT